MLFLPHRVRSKAINTCAQDSWSNQTLLLNPQLMITFVLLFQEIEVGGGRKAIIIFVPVPQLKSFQKIQVRLVRELEKKFSGKHVVFIAQVKNPL